MAVADWNALKVGGRYRVTATDGENMIADIVSVNTKDHLFVYDIVESDRKFECSAGHVLRFSEVNTLHPFLEPLEDE
jgi:hypothetical protein